MLLTCTPDCCAAEAPVTLDDMDEGLCTTNGPVGESRPSSRTGMYVSRAASLSALVTVVGQQDVGCNEGDKPFLDAEEVVGPEQSVGRNVGMTCVKRIAYCNLQ